MVEERPADKRRTVLRYNHSDDEWEDLLPSEYDCRTRVHGYGGGAALCVTCDNALLFVDSKTNGILVAGEELTFSRPWENRYLADLTGYPKNPCWAVGVREVHSTNPGTDNHRIVRSLVLLCLVSEQVLLSGSSTFFSSPRFNSDGSRLCWIQGSASPQTLFRGNEIWVGDYQDGVLSNRRKIAGGTLESVQQPQWSPEDDLFFLSDKSGRWQLYTASMGRGQGEHVSFPDFEDCEIGCPELSCGK